MQTFLGLIFFIFGLIIGSFLNVVIYRYGSGRGIGGRSFCGVCGKTLNFFELVPVFSFLVQGGKCRKCRAKISWQYILVELATGFVFLGVFWKSGVAFGDALSVLPVVFWLIVWPILIAIFVYDLRHKIIPDGLVYSFIILSLVYRLFVTDWGTIFAHYNWLEIASGPILFLFFFSLWYFSKGRWMGFGDGKLALGMGLALGFVGGISAVVMGFWLGALTSLARIFWARLVSARPSFFARLNIHPKNLTMKSEVAFGPFLILGIISVYFLGFDVIVSFL